MATAALEAPALPQLSASDTKFLRALKKFTDSEFTVEPDTASQAKKETAQQIATLSYFSLVAETLTACANSDNAEITKLTAELSSRMTDFIFGNTTQNGTNDKFETFDATFMQLIRAKIKEIDDLAATKTRLRLGDQIEHPATDEFGAHQFISGFVSKMQDLRQVLKLG